MNSRTVAAVLILLAAGIIGWIAFSKLDSEPAPPPGEGVAVDAAPAASPDRPLVPAPDNGGQSHDAAADPPTHDAGPPHGEEITNAGGTTISPFRQEPTSQTLQPPPAEGLVLPPAAGGQRPELTAAAAGDALRRGLELLAGDSLLSARGELSRALNSGQLAPRDAESARAALTEIADRMIFSPAVLADDPFTFAYQFDSGEVLQNIERRLSLRVPPEAMLWANNIRDARTIRAGQRVKMIRGPFHAVVHKGERIMDLYLQDTFVRRVRVGIGAAETPTPVGYFRIRQGGKVRSAPYTPPPSTGLPPVSILPHEPGYPLGHQGLWLSIEGRPASGTDITAADRYGIHGTNEPGSIGLAMSNGCIRLADGDIDLVFALLYEHWSTVTILD